MKYQIVPIALLLALASCGDHKRASQADANAKKDTSVNIDTAQKPKTSEQKIEVIDTANIFNKEYAAKHYFSNFKQKDNFTLKLSGTDLLNANGVLQIKDAQGQLLYEYKFTTPDLFIDP